MREELPNLFFSAMDDIPHADETRTLIKDIWDLRIAKLRSSIDTYVKSDATHAKVIMEIFIHCMYNVVFFV